MQNKIWRYAKIILLGTASVILAIYFGFFVFLEVSAWKWLSDDAFHLSLDVNSKRPHEVTLLDNGLESLARRLALIENAKKSIDLEFFIYSLDESSQLVNQALVAKARSGIKVRVLVDFSLAVFQFKPGYAKKLRDAGAEVKYYNTSSATRLFSVQHRTHRKMLVVDNEAAIIGGRNIANDYFDLSHHYNFLDSDLLVKGHIVGAMRDSFDVYWNSKWSHAPDYTGAEAAEGDPTLAFLDEGSIDIKIRELIKQAASQAPRMPSTTCKDIRFVTDYPGANVSNRKLYPAILETLAHAKSEVLVETPYFILRDDGANAIKKLTERGVKFNVLTNSLRSTDAYYTVAALVPGLASTLLIPNLGMWAYKGDVLQGYSTEPAKSERWGVHAKRGVVDDDTVLLGTYNIDPRSANFNSELMVICKGNRELAKQVRGSIHQRMAQSAQIVEDGKNKNVGAIIEGADGRNVMMMILSMPLASMFSFLL